MRHGRAVPLLALALALALAACAHAGGEWPGGIGAVLRFRAAEGVLQVAEAPEGGAAARAGVVVGDVVVAIDGEPVAHLSTEAVVTRLRGQVGTRVVLRVRRGLDAREVTVERAPYRGSQL